MSTDSLKDALKVAMATLLHEDADPQCSGEPPFTQTEEQAASLVERAFQTPVVLNAIEQANMQALGVQVFSPDLSETEPGQWRFVSFVPCPLGRNRRHCKDEHHHWGRGDHVVPLHPDWMVGDSEIAPSLQEIVG